MMLVGAMLQDGGPSGVIRADFVANQELMSEMIEMRTKVSGYDE